MDQLDVLCCNKKDTVLRIRHTLPATMTYCPDCGVLGIQPEFNEELTPEEEQLTPEERCQKRAKYKAFYVVTHANQTKKG